ncbi:hypothetical protein RAS12_30770 (plasmid) [Achromobacter seleniivolatilans]|uniref:KfrA N-terminal DNA-binding domain-containing protein n=1 Tax=Achromobacter seleniivolatilans TaxID=3047478 RepID=A0ABY9MBN2_9BURK|nr:hypothetical protein [Achromobacter sp. R39]WMD24018.1 hypothetical protein RAS12_30770 [Achromobacter sp. R39]
MPGANNREFLRAFIPLVVEVTGQVYGAQTFQKLLRPLAPDRAPSSTTVQAELSAYRARQDGHPQAEKGGAQAMPRLHQIQLTAPDAAPARAGASRRSEDALNSAAELAALQQLEVERLRQRASEIESRADAAFRARDAAVADAVAARGELAGMQQAFRELQETVRQLTEGIQLTQERAAADNRANLLRVDAIRKETRDVEDKLRAAERTIAARDQALRNTNALVDSHRQQLNAMRRQLEDKSE